MNCEDVFSEINWRLSIFTINSNKMKPNSVPVIAGHFRSFLSLAAKWDIQAYPTLIIFDATGEPVLEAAGFLKPRDLITFGKQALAKKPE